eukprot:CAMPEP_0119044944 /NCGR_PEP_ID=MMETSP1177-20130426/35901_1 /TAXON_ID=2985 /ORGANISM="Ochromonas sp, Strain CCMP1899" /LENGTH=171 /DNA_ID=CAMNT_0007015899 /DNA_START=12 /DNA_END=524 /DNA_ORIENTATION=+
MEKSKKNEKNEDVVLDVSIWETMVLEERKLEAERRGIRVCDLEEEIILSRALEESTERAKLEDGLNSRTSKFNAHTNHISKFNANAAATVIANKEGRDVHRNNTKTLYGANTDCSDTSKISSEEDDNHEDNQEDFNEIQNEILLNNISEKIKKIDIDSKNEEIEIVELSIW